MTANAARVPAEQRDRRRPRARRERVQVDAERLELARCKAESMGLVARALADGRFEADAATLHALADGIGAVVNDIEAARRPRPHLRLVK